MNNQLRVLLVDDDSDELELFTESLRILNLEMDLVHVNCGGDLFSTLSKGSHFDLIIMDINMPDMTGLECLEKIKSSESLRDIPVVIISVSKTLSDIVEAYDKGAHYYVVKPYSQSNYVATIYRLFSLDWKSKPPIPSKDNFVVNLAFA